MLLCSPAFLTTISLEAFTHFHRPSQWRSFHSLLLLVLLLVFTLYVPPSFLLFFFLPLRRFSGTLQLRFGGLNIRWSIVTQIQKALLIIPGFWIDTNPCNISVSVFTFFSASGFVSVSYGRTVYALFTKPLKTVTVSEFERRRTLDHQVGGNWTVNIVLNILCKDFS